MYKVSFSHLSDRPLFDIFRKAVESIRTNTGTSVGKKETVMELFEKEFDCTVEESVVNETNYFYTVSFPDENSYLLFLLRWS